jgi:hypothetical protein
MPPCRPFKKGELYLSRETEGKSRGVDVRKLVLEWIGGMGLEWKSLKCYGNVCPSFRQSA